MTPPLTALAALLDKEATSEEVAFADGLTSGNPNRWTDADLRVGRFIASIRVKSARQALELAAQLVCPWCEMGLPLKDTIGLYHEHDPEKTMGNQKCSAYAIHAFLASADGRQG